MTSSALHRDDGPIVRSWLPGPLPSDVAAALQRLSHVPDVRRIAVMPDVHLASEVCVGTVLATAELIYPAAVGGDIGCGMLALAFDCSADELAGANVAGKLFERLHAAVPTNRHRAPVDLPPALAARRWSHSRLQTIARRDGRVQLGTLGRGNHFLEFQADEERRLWLCVHSGSRAIGQAVRDLHIAHATRRGGSGPVAIEADSPGGEAYLADAESARAYADANRRAIAAAAVLEVAEVLAAKAIDSSMITCDHNHVRRERHFGELLWVHRKGAMPASSGEAGILPGSMGTATYHVEGRGEPESLCSSAHGAGRAMSRERARAMVSEWDLRRELAGVWFDPRAAASLREESPSAYKDVGEVIRAQRQLTRIVRRLRPVLVYKGK